MGNKEVFISTTPEDGWGVSERGYIQGGYDTPLFLEAKKVFNQRKTFSRRQYQNKKES